MKAVLIYAAPTETGSSAKVSQELQRELSIDITLQNLINDNSTVNVKESDLVIFLVATYGDQELQKNVEDYVCSIDFDLSKKKYAVAELGNYYGYDDYQFGAGPLMQKHLNVCGAKQFCELASIDSLPKLDWHAAKKWIKLLNSKFVQA